MITSMSTKGQVVVPRSVRAKLGLKPGMRFNVHARGKDVVLVPMVKRRTARLVRDSKTGLPTFKVPAGTPPMTTDWVREQLADFP